MPRLAQKNIVPPQFWPHRPAFLFMEYGCSAMFIHILFSPLSFSPRDFFCVQTNQLFFASFAWSTKGVTISFLFFQCYNLCVAAGSKHICCRSTGCHNHKANVWIPSWSWFCWGTCTAAFRNGRVGRRFPERQGGSEGDGRGDLEGWAAPHRFPLGRGDRRLCGFLSEYPIALYTDHARGRELGFFPICSQCHNGFECRGSRNFRGKCSWVCSAECIFRHPNAPITRIHLFSNESLDQSFRGRL